MAGTLNNVIFRGLNQFQIPIPLDSSKGLFNSALRDPSKNQEYFLLKTHFSNFRYIREAYGLNECGIITLSYPREKKNSVQGGIKHIDLPDDHVMPVGLPNMYSQVSFIKLQLWPYVYLQNKHNGNRVNLSKNEIP